MSDLTAQELVDLVRSAFPRRADDRVLVILVDVPRDPARDNPGWAARRELCQAWWKVLAAHRDQVPLESVRLVAYPDVLSNNADLPAEAVLVATTLPRSAADLASCGERVAFERVLDNAQLILAPTEYSTTAPLKIAAKRHGFRAATMPGFATSMIPALRLDYGEVARRVDILKARLDHADGAELRFAVDDGRAFVMHFDLRYRSAHASSGRIAEPGTAANLPSGEAYIVPYEGERGTPSRTAGRLPVQIDDEVLVFGVRENRAGDLDGSGPAAERERDHLRREPAYGNMAELGLGVLADFGVAPVGEILLDEKLGPHVAFGRSEHFGGIVGPGDFSTPAEVIHLDRIYIPETQPRVCVSSIVLRYPGPAEEEVLRNGVYVVF